MEANQNMEEFANIDLCQKNYSSQYDYPSKDMRNPMEANQNLDEFANIDLCQKNYSSQYDYPFMIYLEI